MPQAFIVFFVGLFVLLPFGLMAVLAQDRLTRRFHDSFPDEWRRAGGPMGWFWRPPTGLLPSSPIAWMKANMGWAFRLPAVLATDPTSRRDLVILRVGLMISNLGMIGLEAFIFSRYGFPPWDI